MFFVILRLCMAATCNDYYIDSSLSHTDCMINATAQADKLESVWHSRKGLKDYLTSQDIVVDNAMLSHYSLSCEYVPDALIP